MNKTWWYLARLKGMTPEQIAIEAGCTVAEVRAQLYRYDELIDPVPAPLQLGSMMVGGL